MLRIGGEHALELGDDLESAALGLAVVGPEVPRLEVHQRFGVDRRRVEIVR